MKKWMQWTLGLSLGLAASAAVVLTAAWKAVKPSEGEWSQSVRIGPWTKEVSVPALLRVATHPFTLRLLEGRTLRTRFGPVQWRAGSTPGTWEAVCAPCTLRIGALGGEPIRLTRAEFSVAPDAEMKLHGRFAFSGSDGLPLEGQWASLIERQQARVTFKVTDQPLARAFGLFSAQIPELQRAQIDGRLSVDVALSLPSREFSVKPHIEGFRVAGLGTEALLNAQTGCSAAPDAAGFGTWLPRAVIAAEDQHFYEHAGFDLAEIMGAWALNGQATASSAEALHGGSTLSQQLAKLIYTGDSRDHSRKLRELLYAVELDRTLGKARVLNLYLAIAPWGNGQCGAHAASQHFLHKPAAELTPMEAVWLATLLHNPDRELAQMARDGQVNTARVAWVADQLRPLPLRRADVWRQTAARWSPPPQAFTSAMAVSASRAALGR